MPFRWDHCDIKRIEQIKIQLFFVYISECYESNISLMAKFTTSIGEYFEYLVKITVYGSGLIGRIGWPKKCQFSLKMSIFLHPAKGLNKDQFSFEGEHNFDTFMELIISTRCFWFLNHPVSRVIYPIRFASSIDSLEGEICYKLPDFFTA